MLKYQISWKSVHWSRFVRRGAWPFKMGRTGGPERAQTSFTLRRKPEITV